MGSKEDNCINYTNVLFTLMTSRLRFYRSSRWFSIFSVYADVGDKVGVTEVGISGTVSLLFSGTIKAIAALETL